LFRFLAVTWITALLERLMTNCSDIAGFRQLAWRPADPIQSRPRTFRFFALRQMQMTTYLYLLTAVVFETIGTSALQASEQFTKPMPLLLTAVCYAATFYFLSLTLRVMPVGVAYALWSGLGIVLIALIGLAWFGQKLDAPALIGLAMIIAGVAVINLFSNTVAH
jgi:small multidrug resistance pump